MKMFYLIALTVLAAGTAGHAQLGTTAAPHSLRMVDIHSDVLDGILGQAYTNRGNVRVSSPGFELTSGRLVADSVQSDGRVNHIVAETNVVIDATDSKGRPVHATGEKAVWVYSVENGVTNETITLTGNPQAVPQVIYFEGSTVYTNAGDEIVWNPAKNSIRVIGFHATMQNANSATKTNTPPAINSSGDDTNYPPGMLDLPPRGGRGGGGF